MDPVQPDTIAAVCEALRVHPDLVPLHGGRVSTKLEGVYPAIRVAGAGGPDYLVFGHSQPWAQIECWADDEAQVTDLGRYVRAALTDLPSLTTGLLQVWSSSEPFRSDDPSGSNHLRVIVPIGAITKAPE